MMKSPEYLRKRSVLLHQGEWYVRVGPSDSLNIYNLNLLSEQQRKLLRSSLEKSLEDVTYEDI
jgi:hypothetical protein